MTDLRLRLILGKFQVTGVSNGLTGTKAFLNLRGARMEIDIPVQADVKIGDWLTLYTEVLSGDPQ
jgi:hypothetical protein